MKKGLLFGAGFALGVAVTTIGGILAFVNTFDLDVEDFECECCKGGKECDCEDECECDEKEEIKVEEVEVEPKIDNM